MKTEYFGPFHIIQKILKKNVAIMSSFWNWNWNWNWNGITRNGTWNGTEIENGTGTGSDRPKKVERFMPWLPMPCATRLLRRKWGLLLTLKELIKLMILDLATQSHQSECNKSFLK